jgi:tetratricopeptide (TPR) repeat protein
VAAGVASRTWWWRLDLPAIALALTASLAGGLPGAAIGQQRARPASASSIDEARASFARAQVAYAQGDLDTARAQLERAHDLAPSAELSYDLARVHERMGEAATAIALYREYLAAHRATETEAARIAKAIDDLEALAKRQGDALRAPPPNAALLDAEARAMFARGIEAFRAKRYEVAHTAFLAARSVAPLPELEYNLARACEELGRTRDAVDHYRAFLHHASPDEAAATRSRIAALQAAVRIEAKLATAAEPSATDPRPRPKASKRPRPESDPPPR